MNEQLRRSAAHVFVDDLDDVHLDDEDRHHLSSVLRLRRGEVVTCSDGRGRWLPARWNDGIEVTGAVNSVAPVARALSVAIAPMKGDKAELVVEKVVEIGIDQVVILAPTDHTVARWSPDRALQQMARYRRIARSASMQSRRVFLPAVVGPVPLGDLLTDTPAFGTVGWAEPGGRADVADVDTLLVGPEGGWSAAELARAATTVDLGATVLRAETAAIVGAALMVAHRGR